MRKVAFIFIVFALIVSYLISQPSKVKFASNSTLPIVSNKIIIDAGHGGFDGGAEACDGTLEKDINLKIALKLMEFCKFAGYEVIMTRLTDSGTEKDNKDTIANRKKSDMYRRLNVINENPDAVFVSIHLNKFSASSAKGAQVFYSKNNINSQTLAECVQNAIVHFIQTDNGRTIKKADKSIFLLHKSNLPSIIVECGFLSNPTDLILLKNDEYQSKMAFSILCGILEYNKQE